MNGKEARQDATSLEVLGELSAELVHELRNCLQVIATQAYLGRENATRAQKSCAIIEASAAEAQGAITDVLSLAGGKGTLPTQATSLNEVLPLSRRGIEGRAMFADAGQTLPLRVHPRLFARALRLLYDNAIAVASVTGEDLVTVRTEVAVRSEGDQRFTDVFVQDTGPGVPAHIRETLFDPMVTARPGGTGLGLSLARRIAEAHGGTLVLQETLVGALFCFTLPASKD